MGKVIIKCFQTPKRKYFYDRYLNSIVAVNDEEYKLLQEVEKNGIILKDDLLKRFVDNGLLKETIIEKIEHPETDRLKYLSMHRMEDLILQITQQCNLRCSYCAYSGNYYNRIHSEKRMDFNMAKKAIDFYLSRSDEMSELSLSFYGGEPLLEYELIKECVAYIKEHRGERNVSFPMTTNATLLTNEKYDFLINNNFKITISLDGPEETHNANRKFKSGRGSFDIVMKNLKSLKEYNEVYYKNNVIFNCVISTTTDLDSVYEFFTNIDLFYPEAIHLTYVDPTDIRNPAMLEISKHNVRVAKFEYIKMLLSLIGKREWDSKGLILRKRAEDTESLYERLHRNVVEGKATHHGGPCVPGVKRLFVTTDGQFFTCERVSESDDQMSIGNIENGFDYEHMNKFLNFGKLTEKECLQCWALKECNYCMGTLEKKDKEVTKELLLNQCRVSKAIAEQQFIQVCVLAELGYEGNDDLVIRK